MISIIIPSYNNLELFESAVNSVLLQVNSEFELIVTDDSNEDLLQDYILSKNDERIRYYHNIPSKGAVDNWNYGMSLAKGDKLILLHHDESFLNNNFLSRIDSLLNTYDVVIHNKKVMLGSDVKKDRIPEWIKKMVIKLKYPLLSINVIGPCACVAFRREVFVEFDNRLHWKVDMEWYYRLLKQADKVSYSSATEILSHHGHEEQITKTIDIQATNKNDIKLIKEKYHSIRVSLFIGFGQLISMLKKFFR